MANDKAKNPILDDEEETSQDGASQEETTKTEAKKTDEKETARPRTRQTASAPVEAPASKDIQKGLESDAQMTKRIMDKRPKVRFMIPLGINEKPGAFEEVFINGYRWTIKKGVMVDIPDRVADLLAQKYQIETESGKEMRLDRARDVEDALA